MKRFLTRLFFFALLMLVIDTGIGLIARHLWHNIRGGEPAWLRDNVELRTPEVLLLGSSRCIMHYDPDILADSLGLSVLNAGINGNGILSQYGQFYALTRHHRPTCLIYDVFGVFDIMQSPESNSKFLRILRYMPEDPVIDTILWRIDPSERLKMLSSMRRYNEIIFDMAECSFVDDTLPRWQPAGGSIDLREPIPATAPTDCDSLKIHYLRRLADDCRQRGIHLIFVVSPYYLQWDDPSIQHIRQIADSRGITLLDHSRDTAFVAHPDLFTNYTHLNRKGATKFTSIVAHEVKESLDDR